MHCFEGPVLLVWGNRLPLHHQGKREGENEDECQTGDRWSEPADAPATPFRAVLYGVIF